MQFTQDWFTHNIPPLEKYLDKYKGVAEICAIEIGCFEGLSTHWLLENILTGKNSHIHVIDTFEGSAEMKQIDTTDLFERFNQNVVVKFPKKVFVHIGKSQDLMPNFKDSQIDFIYIDGSHKATDVLIDAVNSWQAVKDGGLLIFDDYEWHFVMPETEKPKLAINAFLTVFTGEYSLLHKGHQVIIQKNILQK
jgi:predicted O-methyltransferase YrrM